MADGAADPTYGRIAPDIQAEVEAMEPESVGQRVAMENTLQARRESGGAADPLADVRVRADRHEQEFAGTLASWSHDVTVREWALAASDRVRLLAALDAERAETARLRAEHAALPLADDLGAAWMRANADAAREVLAEFLDDDDDLLSAVQGLSLALGPAADAERRTAAWHIQGAKDAAELLVVREREIARKALDRAERAEAAITRATSPEGIRAAKQAVEHSCLRRDYTGSPSDFETDLRAAVVAALETETP